MKSRIILAVAITAAAAAIAALTILAATNKSYTIDVRPLPGATYLDGESRIEFADLESLNYYNYRQYYSDIADIQQNYTDGALDIVNYYSLERGYIGQGTYIKCSVSEKNKEQLILHYYGAGVTSDNISENVDDYWIINMDKLWRGESTDAELCDNNTNF